MPQARTPMGVSRLRTERLQVCSINSTHGSENVFGARRNAVVDGVFTLPDERGSSDEQSGVITTFGLKEA